MDFKQFLLAAVLFTIIGQVIHTAGAMATMGYYTDSSYYNVWSVFMMPSAGPPPALFFMLAVAFGLISAFIYVYAYSVLKKAIPGKGYVKKGISYGAILFLVGNFPGSLMMLLLINLPIMLVIWWAIEGLIVSIIGSIVIAKLVE
jgi:hypothetical protein